MTLGGVEALGAEVGVRPDLIRSAAKSLILSDPPGVPAPVNPLLGGPSVLLFERIVEGELPESEFPLMVEEIRRLMLHVGQVSQLGRSFSWTMANTMGNRRDVEVAVSVRGGRTRITVRENLGSLIGGIFGGIGGGLGGGGLGPIIGIGVGALGLHGAAVVAIVPLWLTAVYAVARTTYHRAAKRREARFRQLADRLAAVTEELVGRQG